MESEKPLKVYFVVGEDSGDALGADLLKTLQKLNPSVQACGLAGRKMQSLGIRSLFNIADISVMGISAVVSKLPKLMRRIRQTSADVLNENPDILVLIDSPEFSYRVAKKVRQKRPGIKIVKYVSPSVWAWRPGRAEKLKPYIDHILAILPFEPEVLKKLGGPASTYVGHPLAGKMPNVKRSDKAKCKSPVNIVALPGSRSGEISRLMPIIGETISILKERGNEFRVLLPAVERYKTEIESLSENWAVTPEIVSGEDAKLTAFRDADIALAASGTVTLELALYKVPMVAIYKLDWMAMRIRHMLTGWTASLPNLIADYPVVPEKLNEYAHPQYIARMIERLMKDDHERKIQLSGFDIIAKKMRGDAATRDLAAKTILKISAENSFDG